MLIDTIILIFFSHITNRRLWWLYAILSHCRQCLTHPHKTYNGDVVVRQGNTCCKTQYPEIENNLFATTLIPSGAHKK